MEQKDEQRQQILLETRPHFGYSSGRGVGHFLGCLFSAIKDPVSGLYHLSKFCEEGFKGLGDGVQGASLAFQETERERRIKKIQQRIKNLQQELQEEGAIA
ncbi:MAG: hypothetical protein D6698_16540 [Gammaproteobacteria bacterium]|nr:MAG: hypothetical protein D6698_16540 [Gammaproteobacteria bacterium]